jgi:mono/diheme cytochrome c family protein
MLLSFGATALLAACAAAPPAPSPAVPWPGGRAPNASELRAQVDAAADRALQDRALQIASAIEDEQEALLFGVAEERLAAIFDVPAMFDYGLRAFRVLPRPDFGAGGRDGTGAVARVHLGPQGGRDASACEGCHAIGGRDGAGAATQVSLTDGDGLHLSSALRRSPPALIGVGLVEQLAAEMTADLQRLRDRAATEGPLRLVTKGVDFGTIAVRDGAPDLSGVRGVDPDLVVRPFGWKGNEARLRRFVETAARLHFGLTTTTSELRSGHPGWDPDGDGVIRELDDGSLTAIVVYLQLLEAPIVVPPADPELQARWTRGRAVFDAVGCAGCHTPVLRLDQRMVTERTDPEAASVPGGEAPVDGTAYAAYTAAPGPFGVTVNLLRDGEGPKGDDRVMLLSDLRRHDLGPALADPRGDAASTWLTRPLWGLADSGPYLHDGRAPTIDAAIEAHGGEAEASRAAWAGLAAEDRADLRVWLTSLSRASPLRPGP